MKRSVVVDHDILGWSAEHKTELLSECTEVLEVSRHPDLPQRAFDEKIAEYCRANGCDLLTGDAKCYTHFFDAGVPTVKIARRSWWVKGDRPIYSVRIET